MRIAVAGATGRVGHHAVDVLKARGHDVVAISRSAGVDVITGEGLAEALSGVESVIDAGALADLATAPESARVPGSSEAPISEIAGPREESLLDMAVLLAARRGEPVKIEVISDPTDQDDLNDTGGLLPGPDAILAGPTFEEWLDSTP